ncbi:hypothetical protein ACVW1A_004818 [Bradyrhizobium sp. LB1.3]
MADNSLYPFGGLLGRGALSTDTPSTPELSPLARALVDASRARSVLPVSPYPLSGALSDLFAPLKPALPVSNPSLNGAALDLFGPSATRSPLAGAVADLFPPKPTTQSIAPSVKRKAFFSFHYEDSMRVNVVRNAWKISHLDSGTMRSFQDSSLWEAKKITNDDAIKSLIRAGVCFTSAVCVLVGPETWWRRWVRYEIARAVVDGRGLLAVHLNSIRHHKTLTPHTRGRNPLDYMGVGKLQPEASKLVRYYLYEKNAVSDGAGGYRWEWQRYGDYTQAVDMPEWVTEPAVGYVRPLSENADEYDYMASDHRNIGAWLDRAAKRAGR